MFKNINLKKKNNILLNPLFYIYKKQLALINLQYNSKKDKIILNPLFNINFIYYKKIINDKISYYINFIKSLWK